MCLNKNKSAENQVKEWLVTLQKKFKLNERESKELYTITHTCFAHNFDETTVKRVICKYLERKGHDLAPDAVDSSGIFTYRAGSRRYGKWSWQENAFGILAYLLTIFFFLIDITTYSWPPLIVAFNQFVAVLVVLIIWVLFDKCLRGNTWPVVLFDAVNRFMPGLTLAIYLPFHLCKMGFLLWNEAGWYLSMKAVVAMYVGLGIFITAVNLGRYGRVAALAR